MDVVVTTDIDVPASDFLVTFGYQTRIGEPFMIPRKLSFTIAILFILLGVSFLADRPPLFYPDLPFTSVPKEKVVSLLKEKPCEQIKLLAFDANYVWYGTKADHGQEVERLKSALEVKGWLFVQQDGSGYFFEKGSDKIVITSRMWSRNFVLFKAPVYFLPY